MNALATGKIPPAPNPWIALPINSVSNDDELTVMAEPIAKRETSKMYSVFLPYISDNLAINGVPIIKNKM